ncbi:MAG TPA: hypothetical protein VK171_12015 [Fimbriimonas sp.]|nr:hypothetical protein [Fimbriimonas sp.]
MDQNPLYHRKVPMHDPPTIDPVLQRHRTYIYVNLAWYLGFIGLMALGMFAALPYLASQPDLGVTTEVIATLGWTIKGMTIYGIVMFAGNFYLLTPQFNPKWWTLALINIGLGMTTCFLAPFCFKLASDWNQPEVKQRFGVPTPNDPTKR